MAKKNLSFIDLVTSADTETLRAALEARSQIDDLLVVRMEAYKQIAELESQVSDLVGDENAFEFDPPEFPVAWGGRSPKKKPAPKPKVIADSLTKEEAQTGNSDGDEAVEEKNEK